MKAAATEYERWGYSFVGVSVEDDWVQYGSMPAGMLDSVQFIQWLIWGELVPLPTHSVSQAWIETRDAVSLQSRPSGRHSSPLPKRANRPEKANHRPTGQTDDAVLGRPTREDLTVAYAVPPQVRREPSLGWPCRPQGGTRPLQTLSQLALASQATARGSTPTASRSQGR